MRSRAPRGGDRSKAQEALGMGAQAEMAGEDQYRSRATRHARGEKTRGTAGPLDVDADIGEPATVGDVGHHSHHRVAGGHGRDGSRTSACSSA